MKLLLNNKNDSNKKQNESSSDKKKKSNKNLIRKTTAQSVPFYAVYRSGIIESKKNFFTESFKLEDVNFRVAPDEVQETIFKRQQDLLNTFDSNSILQFTINNRNLEEDKVMDKILCKTKGDVLDVYRKELNSILIDKLKSGRNNLVSDKYLTVGIKADSHQDAHTSFSTRLNSEISKQLKNVMQKQSARITPMTIEERLKVIHDINNIGNENELSPDFKINDYIKQGMKVSEIVCSSGLHFKRDHFLINDKYARVMYLKSIPNFLSTDFFAEISELPFNLTANLTLEPEDIAKAQSVVRNHMVTINGNVIKAEKEATKAGYSVSLISPDLRHAQEQAEFLLDEIRHGNQKIFFLNLVITHYADSLQELNEETKAIKDLASRNMCVIETLYNQQETGFNTSMPLCNTQIAVKRMVTSEEAALFMPFSSQELMQDGGMYYGVNALTKNVLVLDRTGKDVKNPNGLILGLPGSGKSMTAKIEIFCVFLTKDENNQIFILDPEGEYAPMAEAMEPLGTEVVKLKAGNGVHINPFDMDMDYGNSDDGPCDPVTLKSDYIGVICEVAMTGKYGLSSAERSIIDRCVRNLYAPYLAHMRTVESGITMDVAASPTMDAFYEELMSQPEPEAQNIAISLEVYCKGSFDTFSDITNVDVNKRLVVYDIHGLGTAMKELGLQVCLNHVWNKTISNKKKGIRTWIYIDEFHILTKSEASSEFIMNIWKRARKWNGIPTAITQNVEDLLKTEASRAIINNCEFVIMLAQSMIDRESLRTLYKISDAQLDYITNSPSGQGLIYNGQTIVPFENIFPSDTEMYKIITTRPSDSNVSAA